jgi:hypothetical protein
VDAGSSETSSDSSTDATVDSTVTDTATDGADSTVVDSTAETSDSSVSDSVADTTADSVADTSSTDTGPCVPSTPGVDLSAGMTVFTWTPPAGYAQKGAVNLIGSYPGVSYWPTAPGLGLITFVSDGCGKFVGSTALPAGGTVYASVKHDDSTLSSGVGWVFDQGSAAGGGCSVLGRLPCCGLDFGAVTITKGGVSVPFTHYSNGVTAPSPPDSLCTTTAGAGKVYDNITFVAL